MRERPSFAAAGVWERLEPAQLANMFARKLGPYLLLAVLFVTLCVWVVVRLT
jgi:hypothetical protein